jgi:ABC-2 type transport system ATP-binding protein
LNILESRGVKKSYGDFTALSDLDLDVPRQSIFGLLGPNGAGKTTFIRIINQILAPDKGSITIDGESLSLKHIARIGYLPEERGLYRKMKVGEQLLYFAQLKGMSRPEAVRRIKVWLERMEISDWIPKKVEDLSKGMQQKIQFVGTVIHEPEILILDEPFSGFDPINANIIKNQILRLRDEGATIIFSTHRMESVEELCDHIALINKSRKVLDGSKKELKNKFRGEIYNVEHKGSIGTINGFDILSSEPLEEGFWQTKISMDGRSNPNDLLTQLIEKTEVHVFQEEIPSVNDIFIRAVKDQDDE